MNRKWIKSGVSYNYELICIRHTFVKRELQYFPEMMSGPKAPDFDAYGLFRATHSHVSAPLRSVLDMCHWHIAPYPIFAYRGIIIPLLCSYGIRPFDPGIIKYDNNPVVTTAGKNKQAVSRRRYHSVLRDTLRKYFSRLCTATLCDMSASY